MRVSADVSDHQIQKILTEVVQRDQCMRTVQSILFNLNFEDSSQTKSIYEDCILMIHRSGIYIENSFRQELWEAKEKMRSALKF